MPPPEPIRDPYFWLRDDQRQDQEVLHHLVTWTPSPRTRYLPPWASGARPPWHLGTGKRSGRAFAPVEPLPIGMGGAQILDAGDDPAEMGRHRLLRPVRIALADGVGHGLVLGDDAGAALGGGEMPGGILATVLVVSGQELWFRGVLQRRFGMWRAAVLWIAVVCPTQPLLGVVVL